ncbi:MAG: methionyl-tRNA formyltransferase [Patescibacteria group bacterium]
MSKNQNVAFFGTSDRSIPILNALKENFNLALVVTKANRKVGRKQTLTEVAVKTWAKVNKVTYLEIKSIKESRDDIIKLLKDKEVAIGVVADFSFMIPRVIIDTPTYKLINIHFSLLPKYRGASPVQHAILNGETTTGITYYIMDKGMDTGNIITLEPYEINQNVKSGELYKLMFEHAAEILPTVLENYMSGELVPKGQDESKATYCYSKTNPTTTHIEKEDAKIDWSLSPIQIHNHIRAYNPWPIAWTTLGEIPFICLKPSKLPQTQLKVMDSEIVEGKLVIKEVQLPGKKRTDWQSFLNGYTVTN